MINYWTASPVKAIPEKQLAAEWDTKEYSFHMAANSYESCQLLFRSDKPFKIQKLLFPEWKGMSFTFQFQEMVRFGEAYYPDPLSNEPTMEVEAGKTQSIWVTVFAAPEIRGSGYSGILSVVTDQGVFDFSIQATVYHVALPVPEESAFSMEYWLYIVNSWFRHPDPCPLDFIKHHFGCEKYDENW